MSKMKTAVAAALVTAAALLAKEARAQTKGDGPQRVNKVATVNQNKANAQEMFKVLTAYMSKLPDVVREDGSVYNPRAWDSSEAGYYRQELIETKSGSTLSIFEFQDPRDWPGNEKADFSNWDGIIPLGGQLNIDITQGGQTRSFVVTQDKVYEDRGSEIVPVSAEDYKKLATITAGFLKAGGYDSIAEEVKGFCSNYQSTLDLSPLLMAQASQKGR